MIHTARAGQFFAELQLDDPRKQGDRVVAVEVGDDEFGQVKALGEANCVGPPALCGSGNTPCTV